MKGYQQNEGDGLLTVGGMGHASMIALELSATWKTVKFIV